MLLIEPPVRDLPPRNHVFRERHPWPPLFSRKYLVRLMRLAVDLCRFGRERIDGARARERRIADRRPQRVRLVDADVDRRRNGARIARATESGSTGVPANRAGR